MRTEIKIVFVCRWGQSPSELLQRFRKQTPGNTGVWRTSEGKTILIGVDNIPDADWTVVLGDYDPVIYKLDLKHTAYIQRELPANGYTPPPFHTECARVMNYQNGYCLGIWWVEKSFDQLVSLDRPKNLVLKVGAIVTAKRETPGQRLRLNFLEKFAKHAPNLLEVWGKDAGPLKALFGSCYRGSLPYNGPNSCNGDKSAAIEPYPFSFCLENCLQENYFSEKLLDAMLLWSFPLYWGCPNLHHFLPNSSYAYLDIGSPYFYYKELAEWLLDNPPIDEEAFSLGRNRILWRHNLWDMVGRLIKDGHVNE